MRQKLQCCKIDIKLSHTHRACTKEDPFADVDELEAFRVPEMNNNEKLNSFFGRLCLLTKLTFE